MKINLFYDSKEKSTKFSLLEPVIFTFNEEEMEIPVGFVSDGASVPVGLWNLVEPLSGKYIVAFLAHDYGYSIHYAPRKVIDQLLYDMLVEAGMSRAKAYAIFLAVRSFGRAAIGNKFIF